MGEGDEEVAACPECDSSSVDKIANKQMEDPDKDVFRCGDCDARFPEPNRRPKKATPAYRGGALAQELADIGEKAYPEKQERTTPDEAYKDPEWLYEELVVKERTLTNIAEEFELTTAAIAYWRNKFQESGAGRFGDPTPDATEVVLDLEIGDKADIDPSFTDWKKPLYVEIADDPVTWRVPFGDDWETRKLTITRSKTDQKPRYGLFAHPDGVDIYGAINGAPWRHLGVVEDIERVGEVKPPKRIELLGLNEEDETPGQPGDDSWKEYYETAGETA